MPREYSQKAALVTGGAQGIGRATAALLAERGYRVAIADRDAAAVRRVLKRFGRLDALVNNAGIASPGSGPLEKLRLTEWNRRIGVNLTGAFLMSKHAAPHLRRVRGAIVNIASTRALQSEPDTEAYAASKGGLVALTHALALSLGPQVRVNCVSPRWIAPRAGEETRPRAAPGRPRRPSAGCRRQNYVLDGGMTRKMIYV